MAADNSAGLEALIAQARQMLDEGDWQAALRLLSRARRQSRDDAGLLALVGDCYAAGERWRQAVSAYEQSLDIAYDADVARRLQVAREQAARSSALSEPSPRTLMMIGAAVVLAAVAVAVILWTATSPGSRPAAKGPTGQARPPGPAGVARPTRPAGKPASPWQMPSGTPPATLATRPGAAARQAPQVARAPAPNPVPPSNFPPVHITKRVEAPATDYDYYLTDLIGSLNWPDGTPLSGKSLVQFDPYTGYAFVTIEIPRSLRTPNLAQTTLQMAYAVARTLFKTTSSVRYVTVRAIYVLQQPGRRTTTTVAFRGNTSRDAYEYWRRLGRQPNIQELWKHVFATCWWNPNIPVTTAPAAEKG